MSHGNMVQMESGIEGEWYKWRVVQRESGCWSAKYTYLYKKCTSYAGIVTRNLQTHPQELSKWCFKHAENQLSS